MLTFRRPSALGAAVLLGAALVAGAWGCRTASGPCPVVTLTVTPNPATIVTTQTRLFIATGRDYKGNVVSTSASWAVVAGGGTIDAVTGLFTAGSVGTYPNTIRATSGGLEAFATVTVTNTAGPLATITVTPDPATMVVNGTQQFVATGRDADGNVVSISPNWSVVNGGGAINGSGFFTAGAVPGTFSNTVRATSGGISGFATVIVTSSPPAATLGAAGAFAILAGSTVTNTGVTTTISGDVGVSPGLAITGLPAGQPSPGNVYSGVGSNAGAAQAALTTAYNDLAGRPCGTNLTSLDLGGKTLAPGVYCFNTSAGLTGTLTLDGQGNSSAVFVIQIGSTLTTASSSAVNLIGGAQADNVYWQVGSSATLGTGTAFKGNILAQASVSLNNGASLTGRALARTGAVTLDTNAVVKP